MAVSRKSPSPRSSIPTSFLLSKQLKVLQTTPRVNLGPTLKQRNNSNAGSKNDDANQRVLEPQECGQSNSDINERFDATFAANMCGDQRSPTSGVLYVIADKTSHTFGVRFASRLKVRSNQSIARDLKCTPTPIMWNYSSRNMEQQGDSTLWTLMATMSYDHSPL